MFGHPSVRLFKQIAFYRKDVRGERTDVGSCNEKVPTKQCKTGRAAVQDGAEQNANGVIGWAGKQ